MEKECKYCDTLFTVKRRDSLYCSRSCKQMAYIERTMNSVNLGPERSIDGLKDEVEMSRRESQNVNKNTESSIDRSEKESETSNDVNQNVNIGHETSSENVNIDGIKSSIDASKNKVIDGYPSKEINNDVSESNYIEVKSRFIENLGDLAYERQQDEIIVTLIQQNCKASKWVSLRFKCLVERLLTVSDMKCVHIDVLKEICNAFTGVIQSKYFKYLPSIYPYTQTILKLRETLKEVCLSRAENEFIRFRFRPENRIKIIVIRWELSVCVPKRSFNELNFKE